MSTLKIFTIGHSSHSLGRFLWLLQKHQIEVLVDVRRYPGSRRHPQFSRENLAASLKGEGIEYHWQEGLGGNRKRSKDAPPSLNRGIEEESLRNYADHMGTEEFRRNVTTLKEIARGSRTAIMCAEGDYQHCHRRLLSDYLVVNDVAVEHVLPTGEVKPHGLTLGSKIVTGTVIYPGPPTLFEM